jgi:trimethylamine monooxygenase
VATVIFNVPNKPTFPGIETFTGRIIHSHDFRDANEYKEQRLSIVGASYSAEDITLQCLKFGAKNIVTSYRSKPMNFKWQSGIEERPLITRIDNNNVHFKDGTIILCNGYRYQLPFLGDDLRLYSTLSLYPSDLYKGSLWLKGGNNKLFYMGAQGQYYTFTMFDVQALWICKHV